MRAVIASVVLAASMSLAGALFANAEDAEVKTARSATIQHNDSVTQERKKLEAAIERAKKQYQQQVIRSKERYLAQLDESLKIAMKNSNLDNANAINRQIERVKQQIAGLKSGEQKSASDTPGNVKLADGLKKEYVGEWRIDYPTGFWRKIAIFPDGTVYVIANKGGGIDVGNKYRLKTRGDSVIINNKFWNGAQGGTVDALRIEANGKVQHLHFRTYSDYDPGNKPEFTFVSDYKTSRADLSDEVKKLAGTKPEESKDGQAGRDSKPDSGETEKLDFEDNAPVAEPEEGDDDGFFGVPLE